MSAREQVFRNDMRRFGSSQYLSELLTTLTDEQLGRLAGIEKDDYSWIDFSGPRRCVAGHALDIGRDDEVTPLGRELSRASSTIPFWKISSLIENEVYRRAMSVELPSLPEIEVPSSTPVEV